MNSIQDLLASVEKVLITGNYSAELEKIQKFEEEYNLKYIAKKKPLFFRFFKRRQPSQIKDNLKLLAWKAKIFLQIGRTEESYACTQVLYQEARRFHLVDLISYSGSVVQSFKIPTGMIFRFGQSPLGVAIFFYQFKMPF